MKFLKQEIICFNSILDGKAIVGIELEEEKIKDQGKYIQETIDVLKRKNVLDKDGKLTKVGILPIKALEQYKKAKEHISINMLAIGILEEDSIVVIDTKDNKFDIFMSNKANIIKEILEQCSFMRLSSDTNDNFRVEKIPLNKVISIKEDFQKNSFLVKRYSNSYPRNEKIYYWDDKEGFEYDLVNCTRLQLSPRAMRIKLLQDIGLNYS